MSTLADTLDAIDAALLPLAPGLILAPGNHGAQAAPSFPATALARKPSPGVIAPVIVYTVDAPSTNNRNLDREGIAPHVMVEHEIILTLTAPVNTTDSAGSRRALLTAEEAVIAALYAADFARLHRLTFTRSSRAARPAQGSALVAVLTFNQRP